MNPRVRLKFGDKWVKGEEAVTHSLAEFFVSKLPGGSEN